MRLTTTLVLISAAFLATGCSREEEKVQPALERAQEKLNASLEKAETRLDELTTEAEQALATARERWEELKPEAERAIASLEKRLDKLAEDSDVLKHLSPETLERVRAGLEDMRRKLAEAEAAHEQGDTDLAVEKADEFQQERAAVEELLVERPDPPAQGADAR